jgi:hypothetical protein
MPILSHFSSSTVADGSSVMSFIEQDHLISVISDSYFDSTAKLGCVLVNYTHQNGRQRKTLVHIPDGTNFSASVSWSHDAQDGTWYKDWINVYDKEEAVHTLVRDVIGTAEDIYHSGGLTSLNI